MKPKNFQTVELSQEHTKELLALMAALSKKYSPGAMAAGMHAANLKAVVMGLLSERNTKLVGEDRKLALAGALATVDETVKLFAPLLGCCCDAHLTMCIEAFLAHGKRLSDDLQGENLEATECAAKEVLSRASAK